MTEIAASKSRKTQKPGRRPRVEVAERIAFVRKLVEAHGREKNTRAKVHEAFVDFYGPTPPRTVDAYLARVDAAWLQDAKEDATDERSRFLAKLEADLALYEGAEAWGAHQGARKLQARVLGLDVQQVALSGNVHLTASRVAEVAELSEGERAEIVRYVVEQVDAVEARTARLAAPVAANDAADAANSEGTNGAPT